MAVSITASVPEAVESQVKARARARAASPIAARSSGSPTSSRTPATSSAGVVGQQPGLAVDDRLGQPADAQRRARRAARPGLHHGQAPALGRRGGQRDPGPREQPRLLLLVDVAVQGHALAQPAVVDARLQRPAMVAVARDVELRLGDRLEHVEQQLDPLVLLQAPEVEQRRLRGLGPGREQPGVHAAVDDVDALALDSQVDEVLARGLRDREERHARIEQAQRQRSSRNAATRPRRPSSAT